jgi:hypothetical protein
MSNQELSHVYVIEDENGHVKIGIAGNVAKRISSIDTASAYEIINRYESPSCANARKIEKTAHKHFIDRRKKGEWFTVPFNETVDYMKGHFVNTTQQLALPVGPVELDREFNGIKIRQRTSDNYLDATAMCQATDKRWFDYHRLDTTQAFIDALVLKTGIPAFKIIQSESGRYGGTWVHPQVSINLAQWCSPEFAVLVTEWVFELMAKGHVSLNGQPLTPEVEAYIDARVNDGITNALAKPDKSTKANPPVISGKEAYPQEWLDLITEYLKDKGATTVTLILTEGLGIICPDKMHRNTIANVLREIEWQQSTHVIIDGKRKKGWKRPHQTKVL